MVGCDDPDCVSDNLFTGLLPYCSFHNPLITFLVPPNRRLMNGFTLPVLISLRNPKANGTAPSARRRERNSHEEAFFLLDSSWILSDSVLTSILYIIHLYIAPSHALFSHFPTIFSHPINNGNIDECLRLSVGSGSSAIFGTHLS